MHHYKKFLPRLSALRLGLILIAVFTMKAIYSFFSSPAAYYAGLDPDVLLRFSIVRDLLHSGEWQNHFLPRLGAPFGVETPWTRPLDVLIILCALPFKLFLSLEHALLASGFLMSGMLQFVCMWLLLRMVERTGAIEKGDYAIILAFFFAPIIFNYAAPGFADHHVLLITVTVAVFYFAGKLAYAVQEGRYNALALGAMLGFGVWVSPEFLVVAAVIFGWLGWMWCTSGMRSWANHLWDAGLGALLLVLLGAATEHEPFRWWLVAYDTVSIVHVAIMFGIVVFAFSMLLVNNRIYTKKLRFCFAVMGSGVLLFLWHYFFPRAFLGPAAGVSPEMQKAFLDNVREMQSPFTYSIPFGIGVELLAVGGLLLLVFLLWKKREPLTPYITLLLMANLLFAVLGTGALRLDYYVGVSGVLVFAHGIFLLSCQNMWRPLLEHKHRFIFIALAPFYLCLAEDVFSLLSGKSGNVTPDKNFARECSPELQEWVEGGKLQAVLGQEEKVIMAPQNFSTYLLWRTPYGILSSNYHRNEAGYLAQKTIQESKTLTDMLPVLKKWQVAALVVCTRTEDKANLQQVLEKEHASWLRQVDMDNDKEKKLRLYLIDREQVENRPVP